MPANRKSFVLVHKIYATVALLFLLHTTAQAAPAGDKNALWKTANSLYAHKQYDSAAASYEKLLSQGMQASGCIITSAIPTTG